MGEAARRRKHLGPVLGSVRWQLGLGIDLGSVGWWAGWMAGSAGFVGREGELSRLRGALGGGTRVLLVVGDAGVGKTRFVTEGLRRAAGGGMVAVWGAVCRWLSSCRCSRLRELWGN